MELKLVKPKQLINKSNGKLITEVINGRNSKVLYLKEGVHTTINPLMDLTKNS
jgi:hypothetical protein